MPTTPLTIQPKQLEIQLEQIFNSFQKEIANVYDQIMDQSLQLQIANEQLQIVNDLGRLLISTLDDEEILLKLTETLINHFNVERASFWRVDHIAQKVRFQFSLNTKGAFHKRYDVLGKTPTFDIGKGSLVGLVAKTGKPLIENTPSLNPKHNPKFDEKSYLSAAQNILAAPVIRNKMIIGVVQLLNRVGDKGFKSEDQILLMDIMPWLALALKNADRYSQIQTVNEIGSQLISTLDYNAILEHLMQQLIKRFRVQRASFWLVNKEKGEVQYQFSLNDEGQKGEIKKTIINTIGKLNIGEGSIVGLVAENGIPIIENDLSSNPEHFSSIDRESGLPANKNLISVPLKNNNGTFGVIQILNRINNEPFTIADQNLLMAIAPWVARALDNAQLYENALQEKISAYQKQLDAERIAIQADRIAIQNKLDARAAKIARVMAHNLKGQLGSARVYLKRMGKSLIKTTAQLHDLALTLQLEEIDQQMLSISTNLNDQNLMIEKVDANIKRSVDIAQSLLKPYKPEDPTDSIPKELVQKAIDHLEKFPQITISNNVSEKLPKIRIEATNAVDYFHELLKNAVKASLGKPYLGEDKAAIVIRSGQVSEDYLELHFSNTGSALPKNSWETIFDQFSSTSKNAENFGLGLWGARTFFNRQGGKIAVNKSDDYETVFVVTLPIAKYHVN